MASGFAEPDAWLDAWIARSGGREGHLITDRAQVLQLLRAQASRLQMFASDAWFWGDPRRIETAQTLRCAAHAARLADGELGTDLEEGSSRTWPASARRTCRTARSRVRAPAQRRPALP